MLFTRLLLQVFYNKFLTPVWSPVNWVNTEYELNTHLFAERELIYCNKLYATSVSWIMRELDTNLIYNYLCYPMLWSHCISQKEQFLQWNLPRLPTLGECISNDSLDNLQFSAASMTLMDVSCFCHMKSFYCISGRWKISHFSHSLIYKYIIFNI